jgi:hypothetical protein
VAGVTLVARGPAGADSITMPVDADPALTTVTLFEGSELRAGRYTVEVQKAGYRTWRIEGVRLKEDDCRHPIAVHLNAQLIPQSGQ